MKDIQFSFDQGGVNEKSLLSYQKKLQPYVKNLHLIAQKREFIANESSINCPFDPEAFKSVLSLVKKKKSKNLKYLVLVGIGGSNLGAQAIYTAMRAQQNPQNKIQMVCLDTVSAASFYQVEQVLKNEVNHLDEVLIHVISKSGSTTETIANFDKLYSLMKKRFGSKIHDRIVATTVPGSLLWQACEKHQIALLPHYQSVGGRFSVFSVVGLFPIAALGFNIKSLIAGAQRMRNQCLNASIHKNPAMYSAVLQYYHSQKGRPISNSFFFNPELENVGKWYRQLLGESIAKKKNRKNKLVRTGITPIVSIGTTDLHSMGQLFLGGPNDKFTTFVYAEQKKLDVKLDKISAFVSILPNLSGKRFSHIMNAVFDGTVVAFKKNKLSFVKVLMSEISEYTLGQYLQWKMMEVMYLAELLDVNAFDQPSVEDYKKEAHKLLGYS